VNNAGQPREPQVVANVSAFGIPSARACPKLTNARLVREHMLINDAKVEDSVEVLWLQGKTWFVDIRIGFNEDPQQGWAFAGQIEWEEPRVTFHHLLDTSGDTGSDCGSFVFTDFGCLEAGEVTRDNKVLPFEEKWLRVADSASTHAFIAEKDNQLAAVKIRQAKHIACVGKLGAAIYVDKDGVLELERVFTTQEKDTGESSTIALLDYFASARWQLAESS
jgi:hypothetical protein